MPHYATDAYALACGVPAVRAVRIDPASALKSDQAKVGGNFSDVRLQ